MQYNERIEIEGIIYEYDEFYKRLVTVDGQKDIKNAVRCPKCHNDIFQLSYGDYEINANCKCGHSMTVYDG